MQKCYRNLVLFFGARRSRQNGEATELLWKQQQDFLGKKKEESRGKEYKFIPRSCSGWVMAE